MSNAKALLVEDVAAERSTIEPKVSATNIRTHVDDIIEPWHYAMNWTKMECIQDEANGLFEGLAMTFGIAIFVTNLVVVLAIKRGGRKLHKATFYCICNLAVADMLAGLFLLWVFGLQRVVLSARTAYSELFQKSVWTLSIWTSLMSQGVIALDRYSHVTMGSVGKKSFPRGCNSTWGNQQRRRMVIIGIALTWIIPTVTYVIPVMTVWNCASNCQCYSRDNSTAVIFMTCTPTDLCSQVNPPFSKGNMLYLSLVLLVLPIVPFLLYLRIFFFVRNSTKNLRPYSGKTVNHIVPGAYLDQGSHIRQGVEEYQNNYSRDESFGGRTDPLVTPEDSECVAHDYTSGQNKNGNANGQTLLDEKMRSNTIEIRRYHDEANHTQKRKNRQAAGKSVVEKDMMRRKTHDRDMRLLRTLVLILTLFVASTVPLGILFAISLSETDKRYVQPAKYLLTLSLLNSLVNPWVYFWRFREMRGAIRRLFCSRGRSRGPVQDDGACAACCPLPPSRRISFFSSQQSTKKHSSSSSSNAF